MTGPEPRGQAVANVARRVGVIRESVLDKQLTRHLSWRKQTSEARKMAFAGRRADVPQAGAPATVSRPSNSVPVGKRLLERCSGEMPPQKVCKPQDCSQSMPEVRLQAFLRRQRRIAQSLKATVHASTGCQSERAPPQQRGARRESTATHQAPKAPTVAPQRTMSAGARRASGCVATPAARGPKAEQVKQELPIPPWRRRARLAAMKARCEAPTAKAAPPHMTTTEAARIGPRVTWAAALDPHPVTVKVEPHKRGQTDWATNAQRRAATAGRKADALAAELPPEYAELSRAAASIPSVDARRTAFRRLLLSKGGPEGDALHKALRAWRTLAAVARERGLAAHGLPAEDPLVADIVAAEKRRARETGNGSRGGVTVGQTFLAGFATLQAVGLPVTADGPLAEAAAAMTREEAVEDALLPHRQAGSTPLKMQLQLETLAAVQTWSVARTMARALLVACVIHHIRLNDALEAIIFADCRDPQGVVRGTAVMKGRKPKPMALFAPARGWLGPFTWLREHLEEMTGRRHAIPNFDGGQVARATKLRAGVIAPDKARKTLGQLMAMHPLCMSEKEYAELGVTTHSPHGSGADMVRFMGANGLPFEEKDACALGHWLRDKNAPQHEKTQRDRAGVPKQATAPGAPAARGAMTFVYSSGALRKGEREEQLALRERFIDTVRAALERFGRPWLELPAGTDDWDILRRAPGARGAERA